eukprot:65502-Rhodomonas_salina.4
MEPARWKTGMPSSMPHSTLTVAPPERTQPSQPNRRISRVSVSVSSADVSGVGQHACLKHVTGEQEEGRGPACAMPLDPESFPPKSRLAPPYAPRQYRALHTQRVWSTDADPISPFFAGASPSDTSL